MRDYSSRPPPVAFRRRGGPRPKRSSMKLELGPAPDWNFGCDTATLFQVVGRSIKGAAETVVADSCCPSRHKRQSGPCVWRRIGGSIDLAVEETPPDRLLDRDRGRSVVSPWAIPTVIAWMIGIRTNHTSARAPHDGARRACDIRTAFILVKEVRASRLYVSRGANCQTAARWISCGGELDSPRSG